jgi:hypothetical protein
MKRGFGRGRSATGRLDAGRWGGWAVVAIGAALRLLEAVSELAGRPG